jgi:hypothetical protein
MHIRIAAFLAAVLFPILCVTGCSSGSNHSSGAHETAWQPQDTAWLQQQCHVIENQPSAAGQQFSCSCIIHHIRQFSTPSQLGQIVNDEHSPGSVMYGLPTANFILKYELDCPAGA